MTCGNLLLKNLLFFSVISSVCETFEMKATQTFYQAEENKDITLEFMFTTKADSSPEPIEILCELLAEDEPLKVLHLYKGIEFLWSQNKQFAGRVQYDKDRLREGQLILNLSRLRTRDSGLYLCTVVTSYGSNTGRCSLNVTATRLLPKPQTPSTSRPPPKSRGRFGLYGALGLAGVAVVVVCFLLYRQSWLIEKIQSATPNHQDSVVVSLPEDNEEHSNIHTMPEEQVMSLSLCRKTIQSFARRLKVKIPPQSKVTVQGMEGRKQMHKLKTCAHQEKVIMAGLGIAIDFLN